MSRASLGDRASRARCTTFLLESLRASGSQATQRMWGLSVALGNAVDELEVLDFLADGRFW